MKKKHIAVIWTVKVAALQGDPDYPNLIATSVYDSKSAHYLSMVCTELK